MRPGRGKDIAYADDLLSGISSLTGLQMKADIAFAFAIIFGLDIPYSKLRTFLHLHNGRIQRSEPLIIHTTGWKPQNIPVATSGELKALGNKYDISNGKLHDTQFDEGKVRALRSCNILE
jgi:hypothetical protein